MPLVYGYIPSEITESGYLFTKGVKKGMPAAIHPTVLAN